MDNFKNIEVPPGLTCTVRFDARALEVVDGSSTLDLVMERGTLKCGVKGGQYGMGYQDGAGQYSGLDISYCMAIAAAIGMDPDSDVEYVQAGGANRFELLADGSIDVLIRTTTWTTSRDADLDVDVDSHSEANADADAGSPAPSEWIAARGFGD